jgi:hypothetical protein
MARKCGHNILDTDELWLLNLETAVEREKAVEDIYVHREFKKLVVTFWVMRDFLNFLGA